MLDTCSGSISVSSCSWLTIKRYYCKTNKQTQPRSAQTLLNEIRAAAHRPSVRHQADLKKKRAKRTKKIKKATRGVWSAPSSDNGVVAITNRDVIIVFFFPQDSKRGYSSEPA